MLCWPCLFIHQLLIIYSTGFSGRSVYIWKLFRYYLNCGSCRTPKYDYLKNRHSKFYVWDPILFLSFITYFILYFQIVEPFTAHYVFALGVARFLSCAHWVLQVWSLHEKHVVVLVSSLIHLQIWLVLVVLHVMVIVITEITVFFFFPGNSYVVDHRVKVIIIL